MNWNKFYIRICLMAAVIGIAFVIYGIIAKLGAAIFAGVLFTIAFSLIARDAYKKGY